jgi:GAF domain-containing protein
VNGEVVLVFDLDSDQLADFTEVDQEGLEKIIKLIEEFWTSWS